MSEVSENKTENKGSAPGKVGGFLKRHKKLVIVVVALAVVVAIVLGLVNSMRSAAASMTAAPQTVTLQRMDLQQVVSGTGTLQSGVSREVNSSLTYEVKEIYVAEGDVVEKDQLLAQLDTSTLDDNIAEVRKNIKTAQDRDALSLAQAERRLQDAKNNRQINWDKNDRAVQEAMATLTAAQTELGAYAEYERLKAAVDSATDGPGGPNYTAAMTAYNDYLTVNPGVEAGYTAAKTTYDAALTAYNRAVETRDTTYRSDSLSIESAQDTVNTQRLQDSAATYRTQLENYLKEKEKCQIKAPIAGVITAMTAEVGKNPSAGALGSATAATTSSALFTIEDTKNLEITSSVPEYDAVNIKVGMKVHITSDALDDMEWEGTVKSISPKATDTNNNFSVVMRVTSPVGELAIGMSAKINIITEEKTNVFAVPYDAVTTNEEGKTVVYALREDAASTSVAEETGTPPAAMGTEIEVETGMETDYYIEISGKGLEEGMLILADPEGKNVSTGNVTPFVMMGGG